MIAYAGALRLLATSATDGTSSPRASTLLERAREKGAGAGNEQPLGARSMRVLAMRGALAPLFVALRGRRLEVAHLRESDDESVPTGADLVVGHAIAERDGRAPRHSDRC